jgi:hypothetical protein
MSNNVKWVSAITTASLLLATSAAAQAVVIDRTGSMARQHQIEADLQNGLAGAALYFRGIRLVFFSDEVMNAPGITVMFDSRASGSGIPRLEDAVKMKAVREAGPQIAKGFAQQSPVHARASNIAAAVVRAAEELPSGLLVTDGKHEVAVPPGALTQNRLVVLLCPASSDSAADELVKYTEREHLIKVWAPKAEVFPCFKMRDAILRWASVRVGAVSVSNR